MWRNSFVVLLTIGLKGFSMTYTPTSNTAESINCSSVKSVALAISNSVPQRFISHCWLNAYDQALSTSRWFEVFILFYSSFLPVHICTHQGSIHSTCWLMISRIESHDTRQRVRHVLSVLRTKQLTTESSRRPCYIWDFIRLRCKNSSNTFSNSNSTLLWFMICIPAK